MISPVASALEIPSERVYANRLLYREDGSYKGFDVEEFTSRRGGKADVARHLRTSMCYKTIVFIGDGATDLEAQPHCDLFIAYGGVQHRPHVHAQAGLSIASFSELE